MSLLPKEISLTLIVAALTVGGSAAAQQQRSFAAEQPMPVDRSIAEGLRQVSPERIQANIEKLVSFGTRSTISPQDTAAIASGRGIGAAREWI